jgi:hypothetical protein
VGAGLTTTDVPWAGIDRVVRLRDLPTDRRHNAKIDVAALRRTLDAEPEADRR